MINANNLIKKNAILDTYRQSQQINVTSCYKNAVIKIVPVPRISVYLDCSHYCDTKPLQKAEVSCDVQHFTSGVFSYKSPEQSGVHFPPTEAVTF